MTNRMPRSLYRRMEALETQLAPAAQLQLALRFHF